MMASPGIAKARDVVVVERSPFTRMAFIGQASRLPGQLYLHEDLTAALKCLRNLQVATLFVSRQALMEASGEALQDLVGVMVQGQVHVVVLLARHDPPDVGGRMAVPVESFLFTPFAPEVMLQAAAGRAPRDERHPGVHARVPTPSSWTQVGGGGTHATPALGVVVAGMRSASASPAPAPCAAATA